MTTIPGIVHFQAEEFTHLELVDRDCLRWLDAVRERFGRPLTVTSDARTAAENAALAGASATSLHLLGRAFDLRWDVDAQGAFALVSAILHVSEVAGCAPEIEFVLAGPERHIHLGWFLPGHPGQLELRAT